VPRTVRRFTSETWEVERFNFFEGLGLSQLLGLLLCHCVSPFRGDVAILTSPYISKMGGFLRHPKSKKPNFSGSAGHRRLHRLEFGMPHSSSDEVIRQARERRKAQVAERAAEKISRLIQSKVKLTAQAIADVIAADFEELTL
jgi:hypothetical protein